MTAPDKIWLNTDAMHIGAWTPNEGQSCDGDAEYVLKSKSDALIAVSYEAAAKKVSDYGDWMKSHNLIGNGLDFAGQAKAIRALTPPDAQAALQAMIDAAVAKARAEDAAVLAESRDYALALEEELRARTAKLERECRLTQAQVDRLLARMVHTHDLHEAAMALGAMPEGYCFCSKDRIGDDSKNHEPECSDLRAALAKIGGAS